MPLPLFLAAACAASCAPPPPPVPIEAPCTATDGDTIRCGAERIRLLGIDAPEMPGHCRAGRACAPGDPFAAEAALSALVLGRPLTISRLGEDRYGRTLGAVYSGGKNASCAQLAGGHAVYVRKWDDRGAVRRDCPELTR